LANCDRAEEQGAQARREVVATDDKVFSVIGTATDKDVDMGMLGVPMVNGDPIEPGAEVARGPIHKLTGEAAQVRKLRSIIGQDD
jgi:hypothetical protein